MIEEKQHIWELRMQENIEGFLPKKNHFSLKVPVLRLKSSLERKKTTWPWISLSREWSVLHQPSIKLFLNKRTARALILKLKWVSVAFRVARGSNPEDADDRPMVVSYGPQQRSAAAPAPTFFFFFIFVFVSDSIPSSWRDPVVT